LTIHNLSFLESLLNDKKLKIVIVSHVNPDGDAVGSTLGFYHFLKKDHFTHVDLILPGAFPSFLSWLPGSDVILIADQDEQQALQKINEADVIFCLDFNDPARSGKLADAIKNSKCSKVLIDHHPDPMEGFDIIISETQVSSTAELVYEVIVALQKQHLVDLQIAQCLYTGIITDTGSFSYACNIPRTYFITGTFMEMGLDGEKIHRLIYDTSSEDRMRLLGFCLSQRLKVMSDHKTAFIYLSASDLNEFKYKEGDTEGVVNYALSLRGIHIAAFFTQRKEQVKISFRSEGEINVNILARKYFNGGGHKNASGGHSSDNLQDTILRFENIIKELSANDFADLKLVDDNV
jgi:bifunctional oligoribonuclease and PAP phosphatase NrnA